MKIDFIVLSLYEVHMSSAALLINGDVAAAAHEERFSRLKGDHGFPLRSARFCLDQAGVSPSDVDVVVMVNESFNHDGIANILFKRAALYDTDEWVYENEHYWKPKLLEKHPINTYFSIMGGWDRVPEHYYDLSGLDMDAPNEVVSEVFNEIRRETVEKQLGIPRDRVVFSPHYLCHHYHAYYSGRTRGEDVVIIHMEGDGGRYNSAVSRVTPKGLKVVGGSNESNLGRLYQWMTLLLGMKPYNHEYKLMGLAPYATEYEVKKSYKVMEKLFMIDEGKLAVVYDQRPSDLYFHFREGFQGHRFDGMAGALQMLLETWLVRWTERVLKKTGCRRVCYGGGVAMNVKANMLLSQMDGVDYLFVPLSPADESNVMGAGYWVTEQHMIKNNIDPEAIPPLKTPYLGSEYNRKDIFDAIETFNKGNTFHIYEGIDKKRVAGLLAKGWTVAVCQGRTEFGQRALGDRSILAHPSRPGIVDKINSQIKYRDFWMPFCPTVLDEDQGVYLENPKKIESNYMTLAFPVKKPYLADFKNVIHSSDGTARPQILKRQVNTDYYDLISHFKTLTDIGVILNTSFNLHGEPIVNTPHDALETFLRSDLDAVWMEDVLFSRHPLNGS